MMKRKICTLLLCILTSVMLTGCMTDPETKQFMEELTAFAQNYDTITKEIGSFDLQSSTGQKNFLEQLKQLDQEIKTLAEISVPEKFAPVEELADKASEEMSFAVSYYDKLITENLYNEELVNYAIQYFESSLTHVTEIFEYVSNVK